MSKAFIYGRPYQVPGSWNELSRRQVQRAAAVVFTPGLELAQAQALLLPSLLRLARRPHLAWQLSRTSTEGLHPLCFLSNFILLRPAQLTAQRLPVLRPGLLGPRLYGPGDLLAGTTYAEWIAAESAYYRHRQQGQAGQLDVLVAILYRPRRRQAPAEGDDNGDRRTPFNQHTLAARTAQVARLPLATRQAVLLYYGSCRQRLIDRHPVVFEVDDSEPQNRAALGPPTNPAGTYQRLLRELATSPDRFDVMGRQPLTNILYELTERILAAEQRQDALDAQGRG